MAEHLVSEVMSREDVLEAQELIEAERKKLHDLVMDVNAGKLDKKQIVDRLLDIDVSAGVNHLLSCDVVNP